jgi:hypothetical protein
MLIAMISKILIKKPSTPNPDVLKIFTVFGKFLMDSLKNVKRYRTEKRDLVNKTPIKKIRPKIKLDFVFR